VQALGAKAELADGVGGLSGHIVGWGAAGPSIAEGAQIDCGNSGTTARLLLGLLSGYDLRCVLSGDESLSRRPMGRVALPLAKMGAAIQPPALRCVACGKNQDTLPLQVVGRGGGGGRGSLKAIRYASPVASAQVKSAILLAGQRAKGTTSVSEPYLSRDHTERLLPAFGVEVGAEGLTASIEGGQQATAPAAALEVPGDPSSAAFLLVAAALAPGSEVAVEGVLLNPTRTGFVQVLQRMGADLALEPDPGWQLGSETVGSIRVRYRKGLAATTVEPAEVPALIDELPILALAATAAAGTTVFKSVGELRVKESDRLAAIIDGLTAIGAKAWAAGDDLHVQGQAPDRQGVRLTTHGDHRLAMTWAVARAVFALDLELDDPGCIAVSYPGFFKDLEALQ